MDRFEEMQYKIALEDTFTVVGGGIAALIIAANASAKIRSKIEANRINQYEVERAAGKVTAKTLSKARKVYKYDMPYPDYVERREQAMKLVDIVYKILVQCRDDIEKDIAKYCDSNKDTAPLKDTVQYIRVNKDDVLNSMIFRNHDSYVLVCAYDIDMLTEIMDVPTGQENKIPFDNGYIHESDIDTIKKAGFKLIKIALPHIYQICERHIRGACSQINNIPGMLFKASFESDLLEGEEKYHAFCIDFSKKSG